VSGPAVKLIPLADGQRLAIISHGELGIAVLREERRSPPSTRWQTLEETLIPGEAVEETCRVLARMIGGEVVFTRPPRERVCTGCGAKVSQGQPHSGGCRSTETRWADPEVL
jgi:hypothetical protein